MSRGSDLSSRGDTTITANILQGACYVQGGPFKSGGYNRMSDATCQASTPGTDDRTGVTAQLGDLAYNGGTTRNYLPESHADNPVLDAVPQADCEAILGTTSPVDHRGRSRPRFGWSESPNRWCDVGSVSAGRKPGPCAGRRCRTPKL